MKHHVLQILDHELPRPSGGYSPGLIEVLNEVRTRRPGDTDLPGTTAPASLKGALLSQMGLPRTEPLRGETPPGFIETASSSVRRYSADGSGGFGLWGVVLAVGGQAAVAVADVGSTVEDGSRQLGSGRSALQGAQREILDERLEVAFVRPFQSLDVVFLSSRGDDRGEFAVPCEGVGRGGRSGPRRPARGAESLTRAIRERSPERGTRAGSSAPPSVRGARAVPPPPSGRGGGGGGCGGGPRARPPGRGRSPTSRRTGV